MKKRVLSSILIIVVVSSTILLINKKEETKELTNIDNMISYTVNGEKVSVKPSKETGYKARTITCDNKSNVVWDNTNWEAEIIKSETLDICNIDFTKEEDSLSYRVEINANITSGIDSISKTTIKNGNITFYPKNGYTITNVTGCEKGSIEDNKLIVRSITNKETCNVTLESATLKDKILTDHPIRSRRTNFDEPYTAENTKTLFIEDGVWTEEGLPVYYFAGNALDNWVYFGGYYWRIIRTNEDGGIRLLYVGENHDTTTGYIGTSAYNKTYINTTYVGYMYGSVGSLENNRQNTNDSTIKTAVDNWYKGNLSQNYDDYISKTAIYCNDRSGDAYLANGVMFYAANQRLINKRPSYKCGNNINGSLYSDAKVADKFTQSLTTGNGKLIYPIALITADEISYIGGSYQKNSLAWYIYNSTNESVTGYSRWYTMTPWATNEGTTAYVYFIYGLDAIGNLNSPTGEVAGVNAVRPVLSLKSCVKWASGDGTATNPYKVSIDSSCSAAEN